MSGAGYEGVRGIDAATGRVRWTRPVAEHGCTTPILDQLGAEDTGLGTSASATSRRSR
jgi:hypothetical protein